MNTEPRSIDQLIASSLKGEEKIPDLSDTILYRVSVIHKAEKRRRKKEIRVMRAYSGAAFIALLVLFFLKTGNDVLRHLQFPTLNAGHFVAQDLAVYYNTAIAIFTLSLICFGVHIMKRRGIV
jgi:hypothetical protein